MEKIRETLKKYHLLNHPFYQAWNEGRLTREDLQFYAEQYFHHVLAFPRYVSAVHSQMENTPVRKMLLENLIEEERGDEDHPELWMRFAEGMGADREKVKASTMLPETRALVEKFFVLCRGESAAGMAALHAYESQVPQVATVKIEGLKKFYGVNDDRTVSFFEVHKKADEYHSQVAEAYIESLPAEKRACAEVASEQAASALWNFLSGVCRARGIECAHAAA